MPDTDLRTAKLWARKGSGWLAHAKAQGQADNARHFEDGIAWANAYLARHGTSARPSTPSRARPSFPASPTGHPAVVEPKPSTIAQSAQIVATMRALSGQGRGSAPQPGADAAWDEVIAEYHGRAGVEPVRGKAADRPEGHVTTATRAGPEWDAAVTEANAVRALRTLSS